jgi:hypothetical protein
MYTCGFYEPQGARMPRVWHVSLVHWRVNIANAHIVKIYVVVYLLHTIILISGTSCFACLYVMPGFTP